MDMTDVEHEVGSLNVGMGRSPLPTSIPIPNSYLRPSQKQSQMQSDRLKLGVDGRGNSYPMSSGDRLIISNRFSGVPGVGSTIQKIHGEFNDHE